jgi:hypothetical protein
MWPDLTTRLQRNLTSPSWNCGRQHYYRNWAPLWRKEVHQEDNAEPHIDKTYKDWLQAEFDKRGWKLEHQAPQGPYTNVLDLQMLPAMSKRHSELLQLYYNNEANAERIWKAAQQVWRSCSSSMVCRAFIHAYRIMQKILENEGRNYWLVDGTPHCNIRRDYIDTKFVIARYVDHSRYPTTARVSRSFLVLLMFYLSITSIFYCF